MSDSKFFKTLAIVVPVITAGLYLLGLTYHEGFLAVYGIELPLFPLASDIALLQGFFALIPIGMQPFLNAMLSILLVFIMGFLAAMLSSHSRVKLVLAKIVSWLRKYMPSERVSKILDKVSTAYLYFAAAFFLIVLPFFIAILSYQSGQKHAKLNIDNFKNQTGKWVMLYSSHSTLPTKAQQITCSKTHCAFWLGKEALILGHDKIEKVVAHN